MSADRLARIENKLETLIEGQAAIVSRLGSVETRLGGVETRLDGVEGLLGGVENRLSKVEVNQEEMKDHIKLIAEGHAATQDLIRRETKALRVHFDKRIGLVEDVVRQHSAVLTVQSRAHRRARGK